MSSKYQSDPNRVNDALASMDGLSDRINAFGEKLVQSLYGSEKVLGEDQFGLAANRQLQSWVVQLRDAVQAMSRLAGEFPDALRKQHGYALKGQQGATDAITNLGSYQDQQHLPAKGGTTGR